MPERRKAHLHNAGLLIVALVVVALLARSGLTKHESSKDASPYDRGGAKLSYEEKYVHPGGDWTGMSQGERLLFNTAQYSRWVESEGDTLEHIVSVMGPPAYQFRKHRGRYLWQLDADDPVMSELSFHLFELNFDDGRASDMQPHWDFPSYEAEDWKPVEAADWNSAGS